MSSTQRNFLLIGAGVALLSLLVLFGPAFEESSKTEAYLFEQQWSRIEYRPAADWFVLPEASALASSKTESKGDSGKGKRGPNDAPKPASGPHADDRGKLALTFLRKTGLYRDTYEVITPAGGVPGAPEVRRRASGTVTNIFTGWSKLQLKGFYSVEEVGKPARLGLGPGAAQVLLFSSASAAPVAVQLGIKHQNGNMFVRTDRQDDKKLIYVVPGFKLEDFRHPYLNYRERRIVIYNNQSYTKSMTVRHGQNSVTLNQRRVEVKGAPQPEWTDGAGRVLPAAKATALETAVKQVAISRFADEPEVQSLGDIESLWSAASRKLTVVVNIDNGDTVSVEYRMPERPLSTAGGDLVMVKSSLDDTVDYASAQQFSNLAGRLGDIVAEQQRLDRLSKQPKNKAPGTSGPSSAPTGQSKLPFPVSPKKAN